MLKLHVVVSTIEPVTYREEIAPQNVWIKLINAQLYYQQLLKLHQLCQTVKFDLLWRLCATGIDRFSTMFELAKPLNLYLYGKLGEPASASAIHRNPGQRRSSRDIPCSVFQLT